MAGEEPTLSPPRPLWSIPGKGKAFVDFQSDVTAADLRLAAREGYRSIEHVKRYTTTGMGTDQGRTSNINALGIVAEALDVAIPEVGHTTFRPPFSPVTFGALAGRRIGTLLDPVRRTPMHSWHQANGAAFELVGQWHRPYYYPRPGEDMDRAVDREVLAARSSLAIMDATTLGKIDIRGADAAEFLNRVYVNGWKGLKVGGERAIGGKEPLNGERRDHVRLLQQSLRVVDSEAKHSEDGIGPVGDRKAFLFHERDRSEPGGIEGFGCGSPRICIEDLAFPKERESAMGQRCEIAAGPK